MLNSTSQGSNHTGRKQQPQPQTVAILAQVAISVRVNIVAAFRVDTSGAASIHVPIDTIPEDTEETSRKLAQEASDRAREAGAGETARAARASPIRFLFWCVAVRHLIFLCPLCNAVVTLHKTEHCFSARGLVHLRAGLRGKLLLACNLSCHMCFAHKFEICISPQGRVHQSAVAQLTLMGELFVTR